MKQALQKAVSNIKIQAQHKLYDQMQYTDIGHKLSKILKPNELGAIIPPAKEDEKSEHINQLLERDTLEHHNPARDKQTTLALWQELANQEQSLKDSNFLMKLTLKNMNWIYIHRPQMFYVNPIHPRNLTTLVSFFLLAVGMLLMMVGSLLGQISEIIFALYAPITFLLFTYCIIAVFIIAIQTPVYMYDELHLLISDLRLNGKRSLFQNDLEQFLKDNAINPIDLHNFKDSNWIEKNLVATPNHLLVLMDLLDQEEQMLQSGVSANNVQMALKTDWQNLLKSLNKHKQYVLTEEYLMNADFLNEEQRKQIQNIMLLTSSDKFYSQLVKDSILKIINLREAHPNLKHIDLQGQLNLDGIKTPQELGKHLNQIKNELEKQLVQNIRTN